MAFAVQAFAALTAMPQTARATLLNGNGFDFADWLHSIPSGKGRQLYHTLCHVLFPNSFERMFSQDNKNKVLRAHKIWTKAMIGNRPLQDAALLDLRNRLEMQFPDAVDYYAEPVPEVGVEGDLLAVDVEPVMNVFNGKWAANWSVPNHVFMRDLCVYVSEFEWISTVDYNPLDKNPSALVKRPREFKYLIELSKVGEYASPPTPPKPL